MRKEKVFLALVLLVFLLVSCVPSSTPSVSPSPNVSVPDIATSENVPQETNTPVPAKTPTVLPTSTMTPTSTSTPSQTPVPTLSAESSRVLGVGESNGGTFLTLELPISSGNYQLDINGNRYQCEWVVGYENRLYCTGAKIPPAQPFTLYLWDIDANAIVLTMESKGYVAATAVAGNPDWTCEVEPLWVAPLTGPYGCYAVTCYSRTSGERVAGTENSCEDPFPYWLYQTPVP